MPDTSDLRNKIGQLRPGEIAELKVLLRQPHDQAQPTLSSAKGRKGDGR